MKEVIGLIVFCIVIILGGVLEIYTTPITGSIFGGITGIIITLVFFK